MNTKRTAAWWQPQSVSETMLTALVLIVVSIAGRILLDQPNFKPGMAAALLAGALIKDWRLAVLVPLVSMLVTDFWLGAYEWPVMVAVYVGMTLPVLWNGLVDRWQISGRFSNSMLAKVLTWNIGCVLAAGMFLVLTSIAVWAGTAWYPKTLLGLEQCFVAAIPFMRWMIIGNAVFLNGLSALWFAYRITAVAYQGNHAWPAQSVRS